MDLSELNKEMFALQNDFQQNNMNTQFANSKDINFQPIKDKIDTTQIKRPIKSGDHRNDINEKMNMLNSTYFEPDTYNSQSQSPDMINNQMHQTTRNNSNYVNNINNLQSSQARNPQKEPTNQSNNFANYYNHNFSTLQTNKNTQNQYSNLDNTLEYEDNLQNTQNTQNTHNTHTSGITMINARNMYSMNDFSQESTLNNRINDTGYHRIEEKKTDYRQNINNKIDNMIFDNPNASSLNPILQQRNNSGHSNGNGFQKDTRMVIQDSNKDYYRQSSNERMSQYSPLSRSSNIPIHMANMSVNDFYGNGNSNGNGNGVSDKQLIYEEHNKLNSKEMLNNRLNNYTPLAKTVQYETNQSNQSNQTNYPQQLQNKSQNTLQQRQPNTQQRSMKPQQWNPLDVNSKLQNVVYNQLPIISNSERI